MECASIHPVIKSSQGLERGLTGAILSGSSALPSRVLFLDKCAPNIITSWEIRPSGVAQDDCLGAGDPSMEKIPPKHETLEVYVDALWPDRDASISPDKATAGTVMDTGRHVSKQRTPVEQPPKFLESRCS